MRKLVNTGVYFSHTGNNHSHTPDYRNLIDFSQTKYLVSAIWNSKNSPLHAKEKIVAEIREKKIERIIIAGYKPGFLKTYFIGILKEAGIKNPKTVLIDFHQQLPINLSYTEWAKAKLICALKGILFEEAIQETKSLVNSDTLVIGGGISGIQASLEIANSKNKVFLVEKSGTIGGHMAMYDKTFPTLDCAACILTPKMVDIIQNPYIELLTYSEVVSVTGAPGNYKVGILKKARRVDIKSCTGCGICSEKCPSKVSSEFDAGISQRKAIYIPFPQAVPNKYLIDAEACRYVQSGKCGVCVKVCPVDNCIDLDRKDEAIEIQVSNIVVATGFKTFDAKKMKTYGYGQYPNVVTSLELERLLNAAGPTGGEIVNREKDKKGNWLFSPGNSVPKSFALIHCVGSRDENHNKYCSRVCCMYSLKLAHLIKEKLPEAPVFEYYIDMRSYGKGYEEFYKRIEEEGVHLIRGKTASIRKHNSKLILRTEDIQNQKLLEQEVDMVVLSVGMEPTAKTTELANMLEIPLSENGWFEELNPLQSSTNTFAGSIYLAGACQGPKDIPDSVVQASAAASDIIKSIMRKSVLVRSSQIDTEKLLLEKQEYSET